MTDCSLDSHVRESKEIWYKSKERETVPHEMYILEAAPKNFLF